MNTSHEKFFFSQELTRQRLSYQWGFVTFFPMFLLPYSSPLSPLSCTSFLTLVSEVRSSDSVTFFSFWGSDTLVADDKVTCAASMVAEEVAVGGSLDKCISLLLSS